ncbi:TolC family protein [Erythrobacter sp. SCSIO 43205]|uniref:TolC family protein n=1 Tax=Erythrobacter sp. SCSIO 43205 TaxID=2779361 RepID=UPI001CA9060D|nr:TolC family protein [Erythrobacter sp. SCSIO 43205]UAB78919.1 TolC family protein [Erythrobacter sp. SCSIO 43205]
MRLFTILLPLLGLASPLAAEQGLPEEALVLKALDDHPSVVAAYARLEAARAQAEGLKKGPYEFSVQGTYQRRSVGGGEEFDEYDAQLSRAFRLPGKARLDRQIGRHGIDVAENLAEDARHEVTLLLASHWFDWLSAGAQEKADRAAVKNYEKALAAVERRRDLRDASQLEVDQAQAALSEARRMLEQSQGLAKLARSRLEVQFAGLLLPNKVPEVPLPDIADARLSQLGDLVVVNSHLIDAAEAQSARMAASADRAAADRIADPTVGLRLFSEFGGLERGAGVVVSIPLGGGHRKALANEASASASAARAEEQLARFNVQETASADVAEARYRIAAWKRSRETVEAQMTALAKLRRGHQLGAIDLADLLLGERMVHDAFRIEAEARAEAMRAITKLRIDSHELWLAD